MRRIGRWIRHLALAAAVVVILGMAVRDVQMIRVLYEYVTSQGVSTDTISELLESTDAVDLLENWSGVVSSVTGVDYEVVETESGTMVEISADELSSLAQTVQNYVSEDELAAIASGYGINVDEIASGDYSSLGLTGSETLQISEEELEYAISIVQQYMGNG